MNITGYTLNADITLIAASEDNNYFRLLNRLIEALEAYADAPETAPSDGKLGGYKAVLYP